MAKFADKVADRLGDHPVGSHLRGKKWAEILGSALLALGVLALVGVWAAATAGYEATSRFSPNYNLTDNDHWFSKFIPGRTGNLCQPAYINTGQSFRTTNGVFLWEMGKQFNVTMAEVGNNSTLVNFNGTGQQYADNKLEHCDVSGVAVDMDLFQAQVTVKLYATCIDPEWPALLLSQNTYSVDQSRLLDNSLWFTNDLVMKPEAKESNDLQTPLNTLAMDLWYRQRALYQTAELPSIRGIRVTNNNNCGFATDDRKGCYESPVTWSNDSVGFYMFQNLTTTTVQYDPTSWGVPTANFMQAIIAAARYDFAVNMTNNIFVNSTQRKAVISNVESPQLNSSLELNALSGATSFIDGADFDPPKISRIRTSYMCIVSKMKPPADFAISVLGLAFALFGVVFGVVMLIVAKLTGKNLGANPVIAATAPGAALAQVATNLTHPEEEDDDPERAAEKGHNRTTSGTVVGAGTHHSHKHSDGSGGTAVPQYDSGTVTPAPSYNLGRNANGVQYTPLKNNQSFDGLNDGTPSPSTSKHGFNSFSSLNKFDQPQMPGNAAGANTQAASGSSGFGTGAAAAAGGGLLGLAGGFLGSKFGSLAGNIPGGQNLAGMAGKIPGGQNFASMAGNVPGAANLQGMAGNIPGMSNLQGMASGTPGASGLGGMASNVPGMPNVSNLASNIPGAANLQGMAGNIPGAANLQGMAGNIPGAATLQGLPANVPGAQNLTGAGLQDGVSATPGVAQLGNVQNLAAGAAPSNPYLPSGQGVSNYMPAAAAGALGAGAGALAAGAYAHGKKPPVSGDSALYMNNPSTIREVPNETAEVTPPGAAVTPAAGQVFRTPSNSSIKRANAPASIDLGGAQPPSAFAPRGLPTSPGAPSRGIPTSPGPPALGLPTSPGAPQLAPMGQTLAAVPNPNAPSIPQSQAPNAPSIPQSQAPNAPSVPAVSSSQAPADESSSFPGAEVAAGLGAGLAGAAATGYAVHAATAQRDVDDHDPQARDFAAGVPGSMAVPTAPATGTPAMPGTTQLNATTPQPGAAPLAGGQDHFDGLAADAHERANQASTTADGHLAGLGSNIPANVPGVGVAQNLAAGAGQSAQGFLQPGAAAATGAVGGAAVGDGLLDRTPRSTAVAGPPSGFTPSAATPAVATPERASRDTTPMSPTSAGPPAGWHH